MIYGLNFNAGRIPDSLRVLFPSILKRAPDGRLIPVKPAKAGISDLSFDYTLIGVCNTLDETKTMIQMIDNGRWSFHLDSKDAWIGVYVGFRGA